MTLSAQIVAIITGIGGLAIPPVVSLLKRENWSPQVKQLIAGACSTAVAAIGIEIVAPKDFGMPLVTLAGLIYAGSQLVYGAYFKGSAVEVKLAAIGRKQMPPATIVVSTGTNH